MNYDFHISNPWSFPSPGSRVTHWLLVQYSTDGCSLVLQAKLKTLTVVILLPPGFPSLAWFLLCSPNTRLPASSPACWSV